MPANSGSRRSRRPRRGGRRPGAGAPKGNLNALKHGENSRQLQQLALALSLVPDARKALNRLARRQRRQQARARTVAVTLLASLLRASLLTLEGPSVRNNQPVSGTVTLIPNSHRPIRSSNSHHINQTPQSKPQSQSTPHPTLPSPSKGEGQGESTNQGGPPPLTR